MSTHFATSPPLAQPRHVAGFFIATPPATPFPVQESKHPSKQIKSQKHHAHTQGAQLTSSGTPSRILLAPAPHLHRHTCCRLFWRQPVTLLSPCRSVDVTACFVSTHTCFLSHVLLHCLVFFLFLVVVLLFIVLTGL